MAKWVVRLVVALVAALFAIPSSASAFPATAAVIPHIYDAPNCGAPEDYTARERGPPVTGYTDTTYNAVDLRSYGALARSTGTTPRAVTTYDRPGKFVQGAGITTPAVGEVQVPGGSSLSQDRLRVAAKSARVFRSGGAAAEGGGISLEQAASAASRNGIDVRMMQLAHEAGGPGYGFTSYTMSGAPFRAANGRFLVTLTDRGLASEADAVNTIAHELNHLREAMRTGMPIVEEGPAIRSGNLAEEFFR